MSILTESPIPALSLLASLSLSPTTFPRPSLLQTLPPEALDRIIRHLSSTPRSPFWTVNVPPRTIRTLFHTLPLSPLASTHFSALTTTSGPWPTHTPPATHGVLLSVSNASESSLLSSLLHVAGAFLTSLHVTHAARHHIWALSAAAHCPSLTSLSVALGPELDGALCTLLSIRGGRLRKLSLSGGPLSLQVEGALRKCTRLSELALKLNGEVGAVLRDVGGRLGTLALHVKGTLCADTLCQVDKACVALAEIELRFDAVSPPAARALVRVAARRRGQMRRVALRGPSVEAETLAAIARVCANVEFEVDAVGAAARETLTAVCGRVRALRLIDVPRLGERSWNMAGVRRVEIVRPAADVAELLNAIGAGGFAELREASVRVWAAGEHGVEEACGVLRVLRRAEGLERLFFAAPWMPEGAFAGVGRWGALVDVTISFSGLIAAQRRKRDLDGRTERVLGSVVTGFGGCERIGRLIVRDIASATRTRFEGVTKACRSLRYRDVSVLVCGVQYLL